MISFDVTARRQTSLLTISRETRGGCDDTYKLVSCFSFRSYRLGIEFLSRSTNGSRSPETTESISSVKVSLVF